MQDFDERDVWKTDNTVAEWTVKLLWTATVVVGLVLFVIMVS